MTHLGIELIKDIEFKLRDNITQYLKEDRELAIDSALAPIMPHADFFKRVRTIQKNTYITHPLDVQSRLCYLTECYEFIYVGSCLSAALTARV